MRKYGAADPMDISEELGVTSVASRACLGLELYRGGQFDDTVRDMIECGVHLCERLRKASRVYRKDKRAKISVREAPSFSLFNSLASSQLAEGLEVEEIPSRAQQVTEVLRSILSSAPPPEAKEIARCQDFFNMIGVPYLKLAAAGVRALSEHDDAEDVHYL